MLLQRIEEASLNSWPALQQILFDGWILRFAGGYTKRANSVNPLFASSMDLDEKVLACERIYREKGLPPIFRLVSFSAISDLDLLLESRGYSKVAPTLVMHLDLQSWNIPPDPAVALREERLDDWLGLFCRFQGSPLAEHNSHRTILQAIPSRCLFASLAHSDQSVACGLGVLEHDLLGLFDLVTDPPQRRKGYGTNLVSGLLRWAREKGASRAYLQVVRANEPARRLYTGFGFQQIYHYWYRVAGTQEPPPIRS